MSVPNRANSQTLDIVNKVDRLHMVDRVYKVERVNRVCS